MHQIEKVKQTMVCGVESTAHRSLEILELSLACLFVCHPWPLLAAMAELSSCHGEYIAKVSHACLEGLSDGQKPCLLCPMTPTPSSDLDTADLSYHLHHCKHLHTAGYSAL